MDLNKQYQERYNNLNDEQKNAVDTIEGPVMVVAGPGTGKTELLSMRAASILRKTDTLPENILCLTFTESGSLAMQKRLTDIIGRDAYNISIFTFHAFGSEIINRYKEYFYSGANFKPADELNKREIITTILDTLKFNDPLVSKMNGEYTRIADILSSISDLKRAGLTDSELKSLIESNSLVYEIIEHIIRDALGSKISKDTIHNLINAIDQIQKINEQQILPGVEPYSKVFLSSLKQAVKEASTGDKITTKPITKWKDSWFKKNANKEYVLKANRKPQELRSLAYVYASYIERMKEAELYDYDDMIMQVVHAMEDHSDLKYDLQEKYHYIMVDEFQDTNMAQMRILHNLTDNPVAENSPNIMIVGDDDQAIYSFQGADVSNILNFESKYDNTAQITLKDNYRSVSTILDASREVITQGQNRLENTYENISKELRSNSKSNNSLAELMRFSATGDERQWVADNIDMQIKNNSDAKDIAIIARRHKDLKAMIPYLAERNIPISYDKQENILDDPVIVQLRLLANIVVSLYNSKLATANSLIPELLSHPAWGVDPKSLWLISLEAYKNKREWLEIMQETEECRPIAEWIIHAYKQVPITPLEQMIDILMGQANVSDSLDYKSPLKEFFFSTNNWETDTSNYILFLQNLTSMRNKLREHETSPRQSKIEDLLKFLDEAENSNISMTSVQHIGDDDNSVRLITAHSSKGLEFDTVYILNATKQTWSGGRGGASITYPENLPIRKSQDTFDEYLRLFYVSMTRAKQQLFITYSERSDTEKELLIAKFLSDSKHLKSKKPAVENSLSRDLEEISKVWYAPIVDIPAKSKRDYLADTLNKYKLSATHVNSFIDFTNNGPQAFLLGNILHFPSSRGAAAEFGDAIHLTLQYTHDYIMKNGHRLPEEDILRKFELFLQEKTLSEQEYDTFLQKGIDGLSKFLREKYQYFNQSQKAEETFNYQNVYIEDVHITGKIDVIEVDKTSKSVIVTDYKTGKQLKSWEKGAKPDRIKAHKYRQQLLFYKLLIENSRDWRSYKMTKGVLQFVEPDRETGEILDLELKDFEKEEIDRFIKLIKAIWDHIHNLDFPNTDNYSQDINGIIKFEDDLIGGNI